LENVEIEVLKKVFFKELSIRESTTYFVKSTDRLLLIYSKNIHRLNQLTYLLDEKYAAMTERKTFSLIDELIYDPIISPYLLRLYSGNTVHTLVQSSSASLKNAYIEFLDNLRSWRQDKGISSQRIRLHTFPKNYSQRILDWNNDDNNLVDGIEWVLQSYSHILSIYMIDGIWLFSMVPTEEMFIGDLREKKVVAKPNAKAGKDGNQDNAQESICRAGAKIEEILRRNDWIYEDSSMLDTGDGVTRPFASYNLAIDVGSSPGGWTNFLIHSVKAKQVISVDRGELAIPLPWPDNLFYWQIPGEDAIERLKLINTISSESSSVLEERSQTMSNIPDLSRIQERLSGEKIDLFCCDANIAPERSIGFLITAKSHHLLQRKTEQHRGTRFIITFKNVFQRKDEWEKSVINCLATLEQEGFANIHQVHLLANTSKEMTVTGVYY
jgi:hypothetical protein